MIGDCRGQTGIIRIRITGKQSKQKVPLHEVMKVPVLIITIRTLPRLLQCLQMPCKSWRRIETSTTSTEWELRTKLSSTFNNLYDLYGIWKNINIIIRLSNIVFIMTSCFVIPMAFDDRVVWPRSQMDRIWCYWSWLMLIQL